MRISDWSSDVCSSDLQEQGEQHRRLRRRHAQRDRRLLADRGCALYPRQEDVPQHCRQQPLSDRRLSVRRDRKIFLERDDAALHRQISAQPELRSEEHTSELPYLMRTSYAVFCLKKKTITRHT